MSRHRRQAIFGFQPLLPFRREKSGATVKYSNLWSRLLSKLFGVFEKTPSRDCSDQFAQFTDDLVATNRFKTFLLEAGADIQPTVIKGLAELSTTYLSDEADVQRLEEQTLETSQ